MLRLITALMLIGLLAVSLWAALATADPQRLKSAAWGMLAGGLIVAGLWMILSP